MLDMYLIADNKETPYAPEDARLEYLGGVGLREFRDMQRLEVLSVKDSFWHDFRWTSDKVKELYEHLHEVRIVQTSEHSFFRKNLIGFLETAMKRRSGIVAYCD